MLLDTREYYKPLKYPFAFKAYETQQQMHWLPKEVPLAEDISDWNSRLLESEKNLLTQLFRFFTQADVSVAQGYRKYLQVFGGHPEVAMMLLAFGSMECFDTTTELLTSSGWKNVKDLTELDKVGQYDLETQEITFVQPTSFTKYPFKGKMHHYKGRAADLCVTPNHRIIVKHPTSGVISKPQSQDAKWGRNYLYPSSGKGVGKEVLTPLERILIAVQADGSLRGLCPSSPTEDPWRTCDVHLHKERKITRLKSLFEEAGIPYSLRHKKGGSTVFSFKIPKEIDIETIKNFRCFNIEDFSEHKAKAFIEELLNWDASTKGVKTYYNSNKEAVDKVQAIATLGGISSVIGIGRCAGQECRTPQGNTINLKKNQYVVTFSEKQWRTYPRRQEVDYDDFVYCVEVPKHNVISRRNGRVVITGNCVHIHAYSLLLDTVGMPEVEYQAFRNYEEMADKCDYLNSTRFDNNYDIARSLAIYSGFVEGMQLFSSFAILLNFPRFGKMKGMGQIVTWSSKDESLHAESMIALFKIFCDEYLTPEEKEDLRNEIENQVVHDMVELEDAFIDLAFGTGFIEGLDKEEVKQYIRYIADLRLNQMGYSSVYGIKENPLPWLVEMLNGVEHANFFETRATEYSKGALTGNWGEIEW